MSAVTPVISAMINLARRSLPIVPGLTADEMKIGTISSDVERNTARRVPVLMTPPEYRLAAAAENPHCGMMPTAEPMTGPELPIRERRATD